MSQELFLRKLRYVTERTASIIGKGNRHFEKFSSSGLFSVF